MTELEEDDEREPAEPSLGSLDRTLDQVRWAMGSCDDTEQRARRARAGRVRHRIPRWFAGAGWLAGLAKHGDGIKEKNWHAVMLASQLPEETEDALLVLRLATELVTDFLAEPFEQGRAGPEAEMRKVIPSVAQVPRR
jgi:hypothetical protein